MAHHQKANGVHTKITGDADMLLRNIRFCAMGRDTHRGCAETMGLAQIMFRSNARDTERSNFSVFDSTRRRLDPLPIRVTSKSVVK